MKQNVDSQHKLGGTLLLPVFRLNHWKKCATFRDIFPGLSRTEVIFQDFPGPGIFNLKIQYLPGGVGTLSYDWFQNVLSSSIAYCLIQHSWTTSLLHTVVLIEPKLHIIWSQCGGWDHQYISSLPLSLLHLICTAIYRETSKANVKSSLTIREYKSTSHCVGTVQMRQESKSGTRKWEVRRYEI